MKAKKIVIWIFFSLIVIFTVINIVFEFDFKRHNRIEKIDLTNYNNLMIVAHPDDETIWGGAHLINDNYLVVCITCESSKIRVLEFKKDMKDTNSKYIMLDYPDKTFGKPNDWHRYEEKIYKDLEHIINYKKWDIIATHNPDGEYGHIHHIKTSKIVTSISNKNNLMYFGKYYIKKRLPNNLKRISKRDYNKKFKIAYNDYKSQRFTIMRLKHMLPHENWIKYEDWN